jgi:trehalose 6-phosphate phosphatase
VERSLRRGPTVYRYLYDDGLPGQEGGFHLCTAWLIESLALVGERERALDLLEQFAGTFGPTGLGPEEYDPRTKRSLGNHPQAYTHLGLINAVLAVTASGA